jgi:hypothetical protein
MGDAEDLGLSTYCRSLASASEACGGLNNNYTGLATILQTLAMEIPLSHRVLET